jgi:lipoprotein-anchoring transpeptidase ErfK/SrfK
VSPKSATTTRIPRYRQGRGRAARRAALALAAAVVAGLVLSACSGKAGQTNQSPVAQGSTVSQGGLTGLPTLTPPTSSSPAIPDARITTPAKVSGVNPATPVAVTVADGTLDSVSLLTPEGKQVTGALSTDSTSWQSTEPLGYGRTYQLKAVARNADGKTTSKTTSITTVKPSNMTKAYLNTTGGQSLENGATYGVGIVPVVHFDEQVTDRAAAEKALIVTTSPHVDGVWHWVDAQNVHWRPKNYLKSGTKVTVTAKLYGVQVGSGLYGQEDESVSFRIGAKHVSIADDKTHTVKVYFNDKLMRTMPTSMGQGGYVTGDHGQQIPLWTMPGTYTVIGHADPVLMDSSTYGLPVNSAKGYKEYIYKATRISTDGIYLHQLDTTVWAQGHQDVSHGCLNLNEQNATWFYNTSQVGDIVQVVNTGGPKLQLWQNGDWSVPWTSWVAGSALH